MKKTQGYTLVEVMLASALFAVVMLYGIAFFSLGRKPVTGAQETNFALQLAEDDLEDAKIEGYPAVSSLSEAFAAPSGIPFTKNRTVVYDSPVARCASVKTVVTWTPPASGGVSKSISLFTVVARRYPWP